MKKDYTKEYAIALFDCALEGKTLESTKEQLEIICQTIDGNPELMKLMNHPQLDKQEKKEVIKKIYHDVSDDVLHFLYVLIDNVRVSDIQDIQDDFIKLYHEYQKLLIVKTITTVELTPEQKDKLTKKLEMKYRHKIVINNMIDTSIIGGMRLIIHDEVIDNTISNKIMSLKSHILKQS